MPVYVAGPVIPRDKGVLALYREIEAAVVDSRAKPDLPFSDPFLERAPSAEFFKAISARIRGSGAVITVMTAGDVSVPVEAAVASLSGKRQLIITRGPAYVPRILSGMPGVERVVLSEKEDVGEAVRLFLRGGLDDSYFF